MAWMVVNHHGVKAQPPHATFKVELVEEPSPSKQGGAVGTGTSDPLPKSDPVIAPLADLLHLEDRSQETPNVTRFNPLLPAAPGGDGRMQGEGGGEGKGIGPGNGIRGFGPGGMQVRIGDMEILRREDPVYPASEMSNGIEDKVELEITIDEHGVPLSVIVKKSLVPRLAAEALRAIKLWRFAAVRYHGVPVQATFRMDVEFLIANKRYHRSKT